MLRPDSCVQVCSGNRKRNDFNHWTVKEIADLFGGVCVAGFMWSGQHFSHCKCTRVKPVVSLVHSGTDLPDAFRINRMVFKQVNEQHRIPINPAHLAILIPAIKFASLTANETLASS